MHSLPVPVILEALVQAQGVKAEAARRLGLPSRGCYPGRFFRRRGIEVVQAGEVLVLAVHRAP